MPTAIRMMTYSIQGCRGPDERIDPDRILQVIAEGAPGIAALQEVDASAGADQLNYLAGRLGMRCYGNPGQGGNAFVSYYPLKGVQEYPLGGGGSCLRADVDIGGGRLHLLNVRLDPTLNRRRQIATLLGPDLLANRSLVCPVLILGDFADWFWGAGNLRLNMNLRRASRPLLNATYPSRFPLVSRDRAYLRGEVKIEQSRVLRSPVARQASSHLPLILTVLVSDPRCYLRLEKLRQRQMEIAPG